jgi:hypothetical protein
MKTLTFAAGSHIESAASALARSAPAEGEFNGIMLRAEFGETADAIVRRWEAESAARAKAYAESPEGIAAAAERDRERSDLQARHDALMRRLPSLDFKDDVSVLDWLCAMQGPSDYIGVIVRGETIIAAFEKHGFKPNANTGRAFRPEDRENVFRYLVGQALDGLQGPAIHGIIHKFVGEWKAKFLRAPATQH